MVPLHRDNLEVFTNLRELLVNCGEAVIGLQYVKEYYPRADTRRHPVYSCKLDGCKSAWGSSVDMFNHVKNSLHLKNALLVNKNLFYLGLNDFYCSLVDKHFFYRRSNRTTCRWRR